jgi:drug/metabolite transporter (DMT)-like permease
MLPLTGRQPGLLEYAIVVGLMGVVPIVERHILMAMDADAYIVVAALSVAAMCVAYLAAGYPHKKINIGPGTYGLILFSALSVFVVGNYAHLSLIRTHKAYMVASITSCYPLITAVLGYLLFGEKMSIEHIVGMCMVVSGVAVLTALP